MQPVLTKTCVIGMFPIQQVPTSLLLLQMNAQQVLFVVKKESILVELIDERINNICSHKEYNDTYEKRDTLMKNQ